MALDPNAPLFPVYWDDNFEAQYQAALGGASPDQQQFALPGEIAKHGDVNAPPPPPPPPPQTVGPGVPVVDEVGMSSPPPEVALDVGPAVVQPSTPELEVGPVTVQPSLSTEPVQADAVSGLPDISGETPLIPHGEASPDEYASPEQLGQRMANRSAEEQLAFQQHHDEAAQNFAHARVLEESRADLERQKKHTEALLIAQQVAQEKRKELDAQATEVANTSPLDSISTGRKIAGIAAAIVGGFAMNKTGRNVGLEAVGQMIDEAAAEQATKLGNLKDQRRGIGENLSTAQDTFQTQEAQRLGMWDHFIRNLETEVQNYDPRGTTAMRTMDSINQARAMRAQAADKAEKETFERMKAMIDMESKVAATNKTIAETNKLKGVGVGAKPPKFEDVPRSLAELRALGVAIPEGVADPVGGISLNQAKKLAEGGKSAQEWAKATRENSPEDRARQLSVGEIVDDHGDPVQFRDAAWAGKIADSKASVDTVSQHIDELINLYTEHGYEPDFLKSPAWQQAQGALASALLESKNADQLGALSGSDIDLELKKISGGVDVTGIRDPIKALESAKRRMTAKINSTIRAQAVLPNGRKLVPWSPPNGANLPVAEKDFIDNLGDGLVKSFMRAPKETDNPLAAQNEKIAGGIYKPLNDKVLTDLNKLIAYAEAGNKDAVRARYYLRQIADKSVYTEVKEQAKKALEQLPGEHVRTER
jgi:hypothetical protein